MKTFYLIMKTFYLKISFKIDTIKGEFKKDITDDSELPEGLRLENTSKVYFIKPEGRFLAYDIKSITFRKTTGDYKKIISSLDKFFSRLHSELLKDIEADMITDNYKQLVLNKIAQKKELAA